MDTLFKESLVKETHRKLLKMKSEMEEIKTSKEKCLQDLKKSREKAVNEIKEFRKELAAILKKLEVESIREVDKCFSQLQSILQDEMEKADTELQIMNKAALHLMKSEGNRAQQFVSVKVSQKKIAKTEELLSGLRPFADSRITFAPDSNLKSYILQLKSLGSARHEGTLALRQKTSAYVIKTARECIVKTWDDSKTCSIRGSCLTDECERLLTDNNNKKLKRVDIVNMSLVDKCSLPGSPYSVCQTKRKEAVVTLNNKCFQFISLDGQMNTTRQISLNHRCYGVAYKDDRLYITDSNTSLCIYDVAGTLLQTVSAEKSCYYLFQSNRNVVFSDTGNKTFVTDYSKGVIVLDDQMELNYSFSDPELSEALALCLDGRGNVLVGGFDSHNAIQIGADTKRVDVVVKSSDGLCFPLSMCFDRQRCTLIITQYNNNIVKFFDLK